MSNTATQFTQPIFKTTATQYTQPTFKTTATRYSLWTYQNHSSTSTKSQHLPLNTTAVPFQPNIHHRLKHTYTPAPSANHHLSKRSSPLPTPQATSHLPYNIPSRPTFKPTQVWHTKFHPFQSLNLPIPTTNTNPHLCTTQRTTIRWPKSHSPTPQNHNIQQKHNQTYYRLQHKSNQTNTIKTQHTTNYTHNIATVSRPTPQLFHREINPTIIGPLLQCGNQSRHW